MSDKPKKTLSPEQLEKMKIGRKKAYEKRKKEREEAKNKSKELGDAKKKNDKEKLLQLEMEAMQQQQDRIDNLKMQVERKRQVKTKLKHAKMESIEEEHDEAEQEEIIETVEEELEKVEEKVEQKIKPEVSDAEYTKVFYQQANLMKKKIPKEVHHYYDDAVSKFDFTLSLDNNIQNMINYVKDVVDHNTKIVKDVRDVQKKEEDKQEVVSKPKVEHEAEKHIDSQISKLIKMRF
jgi:hypothetical protein